VRSATSIYQDIDGPQCKNDVEFEVRTYRDANVVTYACSDHLADLITGSGEHWSHVEQVSVRPPVCTERIGNPTVRTRTHPCERTGSHLEHLARLGNGKAVTWTNIPKEAS
jgi:hypothetical protein